MIVTKPLLDALAVVAKISNSVLIKPNMPLSAGNTMNDPSHIIETPLPTGLEDLPNDLAIFDISNFISVLKAVGLGANITLKDHVLYVEGNNKKLRYYTAAPVLVNKFRYDSLNFNQLPMVTSFVMSAETTNDILSGAKTLLAKNIVIKSVGGVQTATLCSLDIADHNDMEITIGNDSASPDFQFMVLTENFKVAGVSFACAYHQAGESAILTLISEESTKHALVVEVM